jgi:hypothetical protein
MGVLAIDVIVVAAFWIGRGLEAGLYTGAIMAAFTAFLILGRGRSQTAEVVSGIGDERTRRLYTRSLAFTCLVLVSVMVPWFLVTVIQGEPNETLSILALVFNVSLIGSAAYLSRRS